MLRGEESSRGECERQPGHEIADSTVQRSTGQEPQIADEKRLLEEPRLREHAPVRVDEPADPGVRRAREVAPILD